MFPRDSMRQGLKAAALLAAILAVGAFTRFYGIGAKSLWLDEAATMGAIDGPFGEVLAAVKAHDAHPPLYYALLHLWMHGSHNGVRARAFSAAVGLATLAVFYGLARVLLSRAGAALAAFLLAISAFQVYFAQEARHYALAALFVTLSWYFLVQLVAGKRLERWPLWLGLALSNAAALYTFYYSLFSVAAQLVVLLALWRDIGRKLILAWLSWQLLPAALFAFYVPEILDRMKSLGGKAPPAGQTVLSVAGLSDTAAQFAGGFLGSLMGGRGAVFAAVAAALGLLTVLAALAGLRGRRGPAVVALAWLLGPMAFLALLPIRGHAYEPKHLIFAAPAFALLPAIALGATRGTLRGLVAGLVVLLIGINLLSLARYYRPGVQKEDWRGAIRELVQRVEPGDTVVFTPPYADLPFRYYYDHRYGGPRVTRVWAPPVGEPFRAGELKRERRVWVLEGQSNVEKPNPRVLAALEPYPLLYEKSFDGLVGRVSVFLYDTFTPGAKAKAPGS